MGLATAIARGMPGRVKRTDDTTLDALNWGDWGWSVPTAAGTHVNQASAMQVSTVYACVSYIAYDMAKLGAGLFRGQRKGARQRAGDHYLDGLLQRPNNWMTGFEFIGMEQTSLLLRGNGYAVILRDPRGKPTQLVPINPDRVALWEGPDGSLFYMVTRAGLHELYVLRDEPLLIPAEDMLHLKGLTMNGLLGLSPISMAREAIGLAIAQEQVASRWAGNSAQPRGILTTEQRLTPEAAKRMAEDWKTLNSGLYNAGKTAILEQGLKFSPLTMSGQDMQFLAARQFQREDICSIFRVPMYMMGQLQRGEARGISQLSQEYLNYTLSTWIELWETRTAFTFDLDPQKFFVAFDVDRLLRADIETRYAANRVALGGTGWRTLNEVRSDEGEARVEGGDVVFRPVNTAPLDSDVFAGAPDPADPTLDGKPAKKPKGVGSDQTGAKAEGGGAPKEGLQI